MTDFDAIVIGSGAGGLTAAVALQQAGLKTLVLEQHYAPGGWCHSFTLEKHRFSPGVHYIGELGPGGRMRAVYEGLGVSGDMEFCELNPGGYDHLRIGAERFDIPKGRDELHRRPPAAGHASLSAHDFAGGWYPRGGAWVLPRAFIRALERAGGEIRLETSVERILVEKGRAIGVRLRDGQELRARYVISNADPG